MAAWDRLPEETSPAFDAFDQYLAMGPGRSLAKLAKAMDRPEGYKRHLQDWSAKYSWVERTLAYDEAQIAKRRNLREQQLDVVRQMFVDEAGDVADYAIRVAKGEATMLPGVPKVIELSLGLAGLVVPSKVESTGAGGGPIQHDLSPAMRAFFGAMTDEQLGAAAEALEGQVGSDAPDDSDA